MPQPGYALHTRFNFKSNASPDQCQPEIKDWVRNSELGKTWEMGVSEIDKVVAGKLVPENWKAALPLLSGAGFEERLRVYEQCFEGHDGPRPTWFPGEKELSESNLARWMRAEGFSSYEEFHRFSVSERERFWASVLKHYELPMEVGFSAAMDLSEGVEKVQWLPGARFNISDGCFLADGDKTAIVYQTDAGEPVAEISYGELSRLCDRICWGFDELGLKPGDRVAIDMPMTIEAVACYLAVVRFGGAVVSIADSFAPNEIATRLRISDCRWVITQDVVRRGAKSLPMYQKVVDAEAERIIVIPQGDELALELRDSDISWKEFLKEKTDVYPSYQADSSHVTNVLFSSGTTGDPKAIPWTNTTPIRSAMDGFFHQDIQESDVVAWPTNLGWMMGPWLIYASLMNRATMALHYNAPLDVHFGKFVQEARVTVLGLVPSIVKVWKSTGCMEALDWSHIKCFSSTGEVSSPADYFYLMSLADFRPVIEYCGGTEVGGGYVTGTLVQDAAPSTFTTPALGLDFRILDENQKTTDQGELFLVPPSIGLSQTLLNRDHHDVYFKETPLEDGQPLRRHGDQIEKVGAFYRAQGRADDTMNLGGIKTSSAEVERVCNRVEGVIETAAVGIPPAGGGPDLLYIFAISENTDIEVLQKEMQTLIKSQLNPLFKIEKVILKEKLPRTASNKVMRRMLRDEFSS